MQAVELFPDFNCFTCTAQLQLERGCNAVELEDGTWKDGAWVPVMVGDKQMFRCPRRPIKDNPDLYRELFRSYQAYSKGMLPESGGLQNQPAALMESFAVIDDAVSGIEQQRSRDRDAQRGTGR